MCRPISWANRLEEVACSRVSLMNMRKRRDRRTDPCGTPYVTPIVSECVLFRTTDSYVAKRKDLVDCFTSDTVKM